MSVITSSEFFSDEDERCVERELVSSKRNHDCEDPETLLLGNSHQGHINPFVVSMDLRDSFDHQVSLLVPRKDTGHRKRYGALGEILS